MFPFSFPKGRRQKPPAWRSAFILLLTLSLLLAGCSQGEATANPTIEDGAAALLPLEECNLEAAGITTQVKGLCGQYEVPENRADPEGRKISLKVVVLKAESRNPEPDPVFLMAGGPGQAASEAFTYLVGSLDSVRFKRDIVMVDQRGTGSSNPLDCESDEDTPEVLSVDLPMEEQLEQMEACVTGLQENDLTQYTTDIAMQDLDEVRQVLGYDQINLLGVSYGTRSSLAYYSLYPQNVRSMVLDGVAPLDWALGVSMREDSQRAIEMIFNRCENDTACREKFPNLKREFVDLLASLQSRSREVTVPNPVTAEPTRVEISPLLISSTVRLMSYSDVQTALVPLMIHQAAEGDFTLLVSQFLLNFGSVGESMSYGMYYSVWCYEDAPNLPEEGELGDFYFDIDMNDARSVCDLWPENRRSLDLPAIEISNTPVLLISGENDPVTPPENGDEAAALFPNSLHLVLPGMGHSNFYMGCMPTVVRDFIDAASVTGLETGCLQTIRPMPFFLSPVGPVAEGTEP